MRLKVASILFAMILLPALSAAAEPAKVFMFVRDGSRDLDLMLSQEVDVMRRMLEEAGYAVEIATASGEPLAADSATLVPTISLDDVEISNYAGLILPCMAPAAEFPVPERVESIVEEAVALGMPIAAARGSVVTLAEAGGIDGKRYTFAREVDIERRPEFSGAIFEDVSVVRYEGIATSAVCPLAARESGRPDGTRHLTRLFIESLPETT